jgi:hypothetical protein
LEWMFGKAGTGPASNGWQSSTFSGMAHGLSAGTFINNALDSENGGSWSDGEAVMFESQTQALFAGASYNYYHDSWGNTEFGSFAASVVAFSMISNTGDIPLPSDVAAAMNPNLMNIYAGPGDPLPLNSTLDYLPGGKHFWKTDMGKDILKFKQDIIDSFKKLDNPKIKEAIREHAWDSILEGIMEGIWPFKFPVFIEPEPETPFIWTPKIWPK